MPTRDTEYSEPTPGRGISFRSVAIVCALIQGALLIGGVVAWNLLDPIAGRSEEDLRSLAVAEKSKLTSLVETLRSSTRSQAMGIMGAQIILHPSNERFFYNEGDDEWQDESAQRLSAEKLENRTGISDGSLRQAMAHCQDLDFPSVSSSWSVRDSSFTVTVYAGALLGGWGRRGLSYCDRDLAATRVPSYRYSKTDVPGWYVREYLD